MTRLGQLCSYIKRLTVKDMACLPKVAKESMAELIVQIFYQCSNSAALTHLDLHNFSGSRGDPQLGELIIENIRIAYGLMTLETLDLSQN